MPSSRKLSSDSEPSRLDSASPPAPTSSGKCAKCGTGRAQRLEDLDLGRGVGDMIFAAHDMADGEIDIIGHRRQGVEKGAVLAHQHRIGHGGGVDLHRPAHQIGPADFAARQLEAPMGLAALGFEFWRAGPRSVQARRGHRWAACLRAVSSARWRSSSASVS